MATDTRPIRTPAPMDPMRRTALAAGLIYIATFVFSIPALGFYDSILNEPGFVLGTGDDGGVLWGAVFEIVTGFACIGTAVALYPILRRRSQTAALGFVSARILEAAMVFLGVVSILAVFTLRQDHAGAAGAEAASLLTTGQALVAVKDWTFLLGPGLMPVVNAFCLGSVLYRSRLVPRVIPAIGLVGAPILLASCLATIGGAFDQVSGLALVAALPIVIWELSLGLWLTFKGFRTPTDAPAPLDAPDARPLAPAVA